jgi:hypothetical protein
MCLGTGRGDANDVCKGLQQEREGELDNLTMVKFALL